MQLIPQKRAREPGVVSADSPLCGILADETGVRRHLTKGKLLLAGDDPEW
jgi:hypothetical protein